MHFELEITSGCKFAGCIFMGRIIAVCWWGGASRPSCLWTGHRGGGSKSAVLGCLVSVSVGWTVSPGVARRLAVATTVDASWRCHLSLCSALAVRCCHSVHVFGPETTALAAAAAVCNNQTDSRCTTTNLGAADTHCDVPPARLGCPGYLFLYRLRQSVLWCRVIAFSSNVSRVRNAMDAGGYCADRQMLVTLLVWLLLTAATEQCCRH